MKYPIRRACASLIVGLTCFSISSVSAANDSDSKPESIPVPGVAIQPTILRSSWLVEEIEKIAVVEGVKSFIRFDSDEKVTGKAGVNRFFGSSKLAGDKLSFGRMGTTRMAGPQPNMDQERRFLKALGKVHSFKLDEKDLLYFFNAEGQEIMRMSRMVEMEKK